MQNSKNLKCHTSIVMYSFDNLIGGWDILLSNDIISTL